MYGIDYKQKKSKLFLSNSHETEPSVKARNSVPVTPKMLVKALRRLEKISLNRVVFSPREVMRQILVMYPAVEQDAYALLLEVSDKLSCAAAAGLLGCRHDMGYFAHSPRQEGVSVDSRSELMFWLYYKKLLKKKNERRTERDLGCRDHELNTLKNKGKKILRIMSFTDDHLHFFPLVQYRRKIKQQT